MLERFARYRSHRALESVLVFILRFMGGSNVDILPHGTVANLCTMGQSAYTMASPIPNTQ